MGRFLNSITPVDAYRSTVSGKYFVDKSRLIGELIPELGMDERFFCFTRPSIREKHYGKYGCRIFRQSGRYKRHLS